MHGFFCKSCRGTVNRWVLSLSDMHCVPCLVKIMRLSFGLNSSKGKKGNQCKARKASPSHSCNTRYVL